MMSHTDPFTCKCLNESNRFIYYAKSCRMESPRAYSKPAGKAQPYLLNTRQSQYNVDDHVVLIHKST